MSTGYVVRCDRPGCTSTASTKLEGVMPKGWYGRYYEDDNKTRRYCSEKCLAETRPAQ